MDDLEPVGAKQGIGDRIGSPRENQLLTVVGAGNNTARILAFKQLQAGCQRWTVPDLPIEREDAAAIGAHGVEDQIQGVQGLCTAGKNPLKSFLIPMRHIESMHHQTAA